MLDHRDSHGQDGATDGMGQAASVAAQGLAAITDPICGMTVDPATSKHLFEHAGTAYHFCSAGRRSKFEADPAKYLAPQPAAAQPQPAVA
jgi:Cu+-exporting ATPase